MSESISPHSPEPTSNTPTSNESLETLLFEFSGADIILRSSDSYHFRVPKSYIANSSPVVDKLIQKVLGSPDDAQGDASLPVVQLPESGAILHNLLTFVFPVTPLVPSTTETSMELLSVAQKYQMVSTLVHIRASIARQNPVSITRDTALHMYSLAQNYGLRHEALQAAQNILKYSMNVEDMLDLVQGPTLHELWEYYETFRAILKVDLTKFRTSRARGTLTGLSCVDLSPFEIPRWLNDYVESIGNTPNLFDVFEFNSALARHVSGSQTQECTCGSMPSQTIRNFWEALASVIHSSFEEAESDLSHVQNREHSQTQVYSTASLPELLDLPDANLVIRSSDLVNFHVHKSILAIASPFFRDLLSLPQPSDSEFVEGLPVVQLSDDAELLNSLVSMLYPVRPVIPSTYEKVLYLLAVCQKYDMMQVQSSIRAEVDCGAFPAPVGHEVFRAYAIARARGLIPEMKKAARLSLDYPMTFETLGEGLRLFEGWALRDLARFRERCRDILILYLDSFLDVRGSSSIWVGCPEVMANRLSSRTPPQQGVLPNWLRQVLSRNSDLKLQAFSHRLTTPSNIREEYMTAIQSHASCRFCSGVHVKRGSMFCAKLESKLSRALDKVQRAFFDSEVPEDAPPVGIGHTSTSDVTT